jgi:hypothetical protein
MSDLLSSPQFDRPAQVEPSWLKSALGSKLFEAPLAVGIVAATLNCSYAPPARAKTDVRVNLTSPDQGWLTAIKLYNAPTNVPRADQRRNASYVVDRGPRLDPRTLLTAPQFPAPLTALALIDARSYVPAAQDARVRSYLPPADARLVLGTHDTAPQNTPLAAALNLTDATDYGAVANAQTLTSYLVPTRPDAAIECEPQDGWRFSAIPTNPPPVYPPGADQIRNSYLTTLDPWLDVRTHTTAPQSSWLAALPLLNAPQAVASDDAPRNSYLVPTRPDAAIDTQPSDGWRFAALPVVTTPTYPPGADQARNSYLPPAARPVFDARLLTDPDDGWLSSPLRIGNAALTVPADDAGRNSYQSAARAKLDPRVSLTSPAFSWLSVPLRIGNAAFVPALDGLRNAYVVAPRPVLDVRAAQQPFVPRVVAAAAPIYPPGADLVRSYASPARAQFALGTHDTSPAFSWLAGAIPFPVPPVPPVVGKPGRAQFPQPPSVVIPTSLRRRPYMPQGIRTVTVPKFLKGPWRRK